MADGLLIAFRLGVLGLLYLFLFMVLGVVWRDMVSAAPLGRGYVGRALLVVVEGPAGQFRPGDRIPLEAAASIGRDSDNQVVVRDTTVSGRHCALYFRDGSWWVEDLGSTNGTWLNAQEVRGAATVAPGDLLQVGRASFRFSD